MEKHLILRQVLFLWVLKCDLGSVFRICGNRFQGVNRSKLCANVLLFLLIALILKNDTHFSVILFSFMVWDSGGNEVRITI